MVVTFLASQTAGIAQSGNYLRDSWRPTDQKTRERLRTLDQTGSESQEKTNEANPVQFEQHKPLNAGDSPIKTEDDEIREQLKNNLSPQPTVSPTDEEDSSKAKADDPDTSPELIKDWDLWHKHVATEIYRRFDQIAQKLFHGRPLSCRVGYSQISNGLQEKNRKKGISVHNKFK